MAVVWCRRCRRSERLVGVVLQDERVCQALQGSCLLGGKKRKREESQDQTLETAPRVIEGQFDGAIEPYDTSLETEYLCRRQVQSKIGRQSCAQKESCLLAETKHIFSLKSVVDGQFDGANEPYDTKLEMFYFFHRSVQVALRFQRDHGLPVARFSQQQAAVPVAIGTRTLAVPQARAPSLSRPTPTRRFLQPILPKPATRESNSNAARTTTRQTSGSEPSHDYQGTVKRASPTVPDETESFSSASQGSSSQNPGPASRQYVPIAPQPVLGLFFVVPPPADNVRPITPSTPAARTVSNAKVRGLKYEELEETDVLSGRGGSINTYPGNVEFQKLIKAHRSEYKNSRLGSKKQVAQKVVAMIREKQGRFLKRDEKSKLWFEVDDAEAIKKTGNALREERKGK